MRTKILDKNLEKFILSLNKLTQVKIVRTIELLEKFGYNLRYPYCKKITDEIFELRIRGKQEIRIFYSFFGSKIVLLHGFIKKSQKTPSREIKTTLNKLKQLT